MRKFVCLLMVCILCLSFTGCGADFLGSKKEDLNAFCDKVSESQDLLDAVADDIYDNWYDAIYNDEFAEDINLAIASAQVDHSSDLERIEELDSEIADLFKKLKTDEEYGDLVKDVMSAYSDYYEFVVNVSGSFNSYSASKETLKKELASVLKDLSYEI